MILLLLAAMTAQASAFSFHAQDVVTDQKVSFPSAKAKATVVVFMSAKCPCSASHELVLKELSKEYTPKGFEFVGVHANQDEKFATTQSHFKASQFAFSVVEDKNAKIANELKALKTPHVFIIQKDKIVFKGGVDDSADAAEAEKHYLRTALEELAADKPVTLAKARALGCVIKR
jgi:alkyl hydroperoxide reductase subunit AhpC